MQYPVTNLVLNFSVLLVFSLIIWTTYRKSKPNPNDRYRTFWPRFWAPGVDSFVLLPISGVTLLFQTTTEMSLVAISLLGLSHHFLSFSYTVFMHGKYGMTVGKMVCHVKVVDNVTEQPITYKQAIMRDIIPIVLIVLMFVLTVFGFADSMDPVNSSLGANSNSALLVLSMITGSIMMLWFLAEVITMLTNPKRRALHDFIAGTVVVRTNCEESVE